MTEFSKPKACILSVCLSLVSVFLCLLVIETVLTIRYNNKQSRIESARGHRELCTRASEIKGLIYTRIPGKCGANSHGFRDYAYSYSKSETDFRIVIVGDSVAEGLGVSLEDTFGKVLEKSLSQARQGKENKVEVIVLAQNGYSTSQELILLKKEALSYFPDLIIWSYVLNDPSHAVYHNANGDLGDYHFKPQLQTTSFISRKIFSIIEKYKMNSCQKVEHHTLLHCVYWDQVQFNIREIARVSQENGIPIIFLIHPVFEENGNYDDYFPAPVHEKLGEVASASGLSVLDLLNVYRSYKPDELKLPKVGGYDPWHPNEKGHRIVAEVLFQSVNENTHFQDWIARVRWDVYYVFYWAAPAFTACTTCLSIAKR